MRQTAVSTPRAFATSALFLLGLAATCLTMACASVRTGRQGRAGNDGQAAVDQPRADPLSRTGYAGELPKPYMQMSAQELVDFANTLGWSGAERERKCKGGNCGSGHARLRLQAVEDSYKLRLDDNSISPKGVMVARMSNQGNQDEDRYSVPAGGTLYIVLVGGGSGGYTQYYVTITGPTGNLQRTWTQTGSFTKCDHPTGHRSVPEADFQGCYHADASSGAMAVRARMADPFIDDAWISCSEGCCTSKPS